MGYFEFSWITLFYNENIPVISKYDINMKSWKIKMSLTTST